MHFDPTSGVSGDGRGPGSGDGSILPCSSLSFAPPQAFAAGASTWDIAAGDVNGDGRADVAVANDINASTAGILRGDGSGVLGAPTTIPYGAPDLTVVRLVDLDHDGALDLVTSLGGTVGVQRGNGQGGFAAVTSYSSTGAGFPDNIAFADFDGDGHLDMFAPPSISQSVEVLYGDGTGAFIASSGFIVDGYSYYSAAGDLNGDGRADLVIALANPVPAELQVMIAQPTRGSFVSTRYTTGVGVGLVALGDLDRDGHLDIVDDLRTGSVAILRGQGGAQFAAPVQTVVAAGQPSALALADLDGDGVLDLVVAREIDNTVSTLHGNGDATFAPRVTYTVPGPNALAIADLNRDGHLDLALASRNTSAVQVLLATCH